MRMYDFSLLNNMFTQAVTIVITNSTAPNIVSVGRFFNGPDGNSVTGIIRHAAINAASAERVGLFLNALRRITVDGSMLEQGD